MGVAYLSALGRKPTPVEIQAVERYLQQEMTGVDGGTVLSEEELRRGAWARFCHALFASLDFRYIE